MLVWGLASLVGSKASVFSGRSTSSQDMKLLPGLFGVLLLLFGGRASVFSCKYISSHDMKLIPRLFGALLVLLVATLLCLVTGLLHPRT